MPDVQDKDTSRIGKQRWFEMVVFHKLLCKGYIILDLNRGLTEMRGKTELKLTFFSNKKIDLKETLDLTYGSFNQRQRKEREREGEREWEMTTDGKTRQGFFHVLPISHNDLHRL